MRPSRIVTLIEGGLKVTRVRLVTP